MNSSKKVPSSSTGADERAGDGTLIKNQGTPTGSSKVQAWLKRNHFPDNEEVIRNLPLRNPVIWLQ